MLWKMYISFQMAMLGIKLLNSWGESINISNMFLPYAPMGPFCKWLVLERVKRVQKNTAPKEVIWSTRELQIYIEKKRETTT